MVILIIKLHWQSVNLLKIFCLMSGFFCSLAICNADLLLVINDPECSRKFLRITFEYPRLRNL